MKVIAFVLTLCALARAQSHHQGALASDFGARISRRDLEIVQSPKKEPTSWRVSRDLDDDEQKEPAAQDTADTKPDTPPDTPVTTEANEQNATQQQEDQQLLNTKLDDLMSEMFPHGVTQKRRLSDEDAATASKQPRQPETNWPFHNSFHNQPHWTYNGIPSVQVPMVGKSPEEPSEEFMPRRKPQIIMMHNNVPMMAQPQVPRLNTIPLQNAFFYSAPSTYNPWQANTWFQSWQSPNAGWMNPWHAESRVIHQSPASTHYHAQPNSVDNRQQQALYRQPLPEPMMSDWGWKAPESWINKGPQHYVPQTKMVQPVSWAIGPILDKNPVQNDASRLSPWPVLYGLHEETGTKGGQQGTKGGKHGTKGGRQETKSGLEMGNDDPGTKQPTRVLPWPALYGLPEKSGTKGGTYGTKGGEHGTKGGHQETKSGLSNDAQGTQGETKSSDNKPIDSDDTKQAEAVMEKTEAEKVSR